MALGGYAACFSSCLQAVGVWAGPALLYQGFPAVCACLWMSSRQQGLALPARVAEWALALSFAKVVGGVVLVGGFTWLTDTCFEKRPCMTDVKQQIHQACADFDHGAAEEMGEKLKFFVIAQGSSEITRELLARYFATKPHGGKGMVPELVTILFSVLDADNSGTISFTEFGSGLAIIRAAQAGSCRKAMHDFAWRALDIDFDGYITEDELLTWMKILLKLDAVNAEDHQNSAEETVQKYMRIYDKNNDGRISREEFDAVGDCILCMEQVHALLKSVGMPKERKRPSS